MKRILVSNVMMLNERPRFDRELRQRHYEPIWAEVQQFLSEQQCLELVGDIDGWLAGDDRITHAVLAKSLPRLKVISKWGTGLDSIDLEAARALGVPVLNSPGAFATAVAEVALGYMLMLTRQLGSIDRAVRAGAWPKPRGQELSGALLGMVGFGAIGRKIATLCSAFGMKVQFFDPGVTQAVDLGLVRAEPVSLDEIAAGSDIVCLACSLNRNNHHLVDGRFLARMKASAFLINVGRGALVDESALLTALTTRTLAGAGLDVYDVEPLAAGHALAQLENVVLGSHNANNGRNAVEAVHENTLNNLARHLE